MPDRHPYRVTSRRGDLVLIWQAGEGDDPDTLAVDDGDGRGRLLAFHDAESLGKHCAGRGWALAVEVGQDEPASLDLGPVRSWAEGTYRGPAPSGPLLEAWNFFEDLARSVRAGSPLLRVQGAVHDAAYERIFDEGGAEAWTDEEAAAARGFLTAGLALWEEEARSALVPDGFPLSPPRGAPGARRHATDTPSGTPSAGKPDTAPDALPSAGHENGECRKNT
ncbi:hypothetical protein R1T08_05110 [Streptomyces sp. SBC-4]|nr:hypothetical protein [Streptomyces sp. SBC-4]MDV5143676.1 hypothetical protein [Streptomyces sp. SBC-4]